MRLLLIPAAMAITVALAGDCDGGDTVRALSPFLLPGPVQCEHPIAGGWLPADSGSDYAWAILPPSNWEESCATESYSLVIADTDLARAMLDSTSVAAFAGDDSALVLIHADARLAANWARDSTALARSKGERELSEWFLNLTMGRIGGEPFVDLSRSEHHESGPLGGRLSIATHGLWHLTATDDALTLTPLDDDWLREGLDSGWIALPFTQVQGARILTAPTDSLRRFVLHHARDTVAFPPDKAIRLRRMQR